MGAIVEVCFVVVGAVVVGAIVVGLVFVVGAIVVVLVFLEVVDGVGELDVSVGRLLILLAERQVISSSVSCL